MEGDGQYLLLNYPLNINNMPPNALGDVRWSLATALHGAVVSGQINIVKYLIDHGAQVDAKNRLGWTPLMLANGVFVSNTKKEFPEIAVLLKKEMAARGPAPRRASRHPLSLRTSPWRTHSCVPRSHSCEREQGLSGIYA